MRKWTNSIITIALLVFIVRQYYVYRIAPDIKPFKLELTELNGQISTIEDFKGKPIILNFFTTWCGPCLKEMPSLVEAKSKLADEDVKVLVVSDEDINEIRGYVNKYGFNIPFYKLSNTTLENIGVNTIPTTYIINKDGEIVFKHVGNYNFSDPDNLEDIRALVE